MHQLSPQETFPIVYTLSDPGDTSTYYVRAVMRNSVTGAIIRVNNLNYINLTDQGNRRFSKNIQAPTDSSGQGLWIDIVVSVYTDSGYTTKSLNYQELETKYLVQQRWNMALNGGAGGFINTGKAETNSSTINYKKLKEIILEAMLEALNALPTTDIPEFDLSPVLAKLSLLEPIIRAIKIPDPIPQKPIDLGPVLRAIGAIKETDLTPVLEKIDAIDIPVQKDPVIVDQKNLLQEIHTAIKSLETLPEPIDPIIEKEARLSKLFGGPVKLSTDRVKNLQQ